MAVIALIFAIFLANRVKPEQIGITASRATDVNTLPEGSSEAVFALQIRQIPTTSEATPAASAGNNLNVVATSQRLNVAWNFEPISTIYSFQHKKTSDEKYDGKGNVDLLISTDESTINKQENSFANSYSRGLRSLPLVWDSCLETTYKESQKNLFKLQNDMETAHHDTPVKGNNNKHNFSIWNKRNTNENNTTAIRAWLDKYNTLKNTNFEERRQPKPETSILTRKMSTLSSTNPSTTVPIVPITREVFKEDTEDIFVEFVTDKNISVDNTSYTEDWFAPKDKTKIKFSGQPQRETYLIPTLKLGKGFHPFGFMSEFFSLIYPFEFPVGKLLNIYIYFTHTCVTIIIADYFSPQESHNLHFLLLNIVN